MTTTTMTTTTTMMTTTKNSSKTNEEIREAMLDEILAEELYMMKLLKMRKSKQPYLNNLIAAEMFWKEDFIEICIAKIAEGEQKPLFRKLKSMFDVSTTRKGKNPYTTQLEYQKAKSYPIANIFRHLGVELYCTKRLIECMYHDDATASMKIYENSNSFYCFWCNTGWDWIRLIQDKLSLSFINAVELINKL